jgi:hypothetical protein
MAVGRSRGVVDVDAAGSSIDSRQGGPITEPNATPCTLPAVPECRILSRDSSTWLVKIL